MSDEVDVAQLAVTLRDAATGLDRYIEQRAAEIAAPVIAAAQAEAYGLVAERDAQLRRKDDLIEELRHVMRIRDRMLDDCRQQLGLPRDPYVVQERAEEATRKAAESTALGKGDARMRR